MSVIPRDPPPQSLKRIRLNLVLPAGPNRSNLLTVKSSLLVPVMVHCTKTYIRHKIQNYGPKLWKGNIFTCSQYLPKFNDNSFVTLTAKENTKALKNAVTPHL
jgi:hypothetical protein